MSDMLHNPTASGGGTSSAAPSSSPPGANPLAAPVQQRAQRQRQPLDRQRRGRGYGNNITRSLSALISLTGGSRHAIPPAVHGDHVRARRPRRIGAHSYDQDDPVRDQPAFNSRPSVVISTTTAGFNTAFYNSFGFCGPSNGQGAAASDGRGLFRRRGQREATTSDQGRDNVSYARTDQPNRLAGRRHGTGLRTSRPRWNAFKA